MSNLFVIYGERGNSALPFRSCSFTISLRRASRQPIFHLFLSLVLPLCLSPSLRHSTRSDHVHHTGKSIFGNNEMSALFSPTASRRCIDVSLETRSHLDIPLYHIDKYQLTDPIIVSRIATATRSTINYT